MGVCVALLSRCAATTTAPVGSRPSGPTGAASPTASPVPRGGTLRVVVPNDRTPAFSLIRSKDVKPGVLDPAREFIDALSILRCCLTRTLLSHNGQDTAHGGARLRPDLAEALPEVAADGVTWTFHLRHGLHYAPPLSNVEITAGDIVRGFRRSMTVDPLGIYFFGDVEGAADYAAGKAASISGLETPDPYTLVIRLTRPAGDLGPRMALPGTTPIPPDPSRPDARFGVATGHDDGYGRFLVSTGPYMVEGAEKLDFSLPPDLRQPASGLVPTRSLVLVRNPSWTDDDLRSGHADRIEFTFGGSADEALAAFDAGRYDMVWNSNPSPIYAPAQIDPYLKGQRPGRVILDDRDSLRGLFLNTALPPFDDVHVRKAANLVVNKARLVELSGGAAAAEAAGHVVIDSLLDNLLIDYDPYSTPGHAGDVNAAQAELRLSTYDADHDGRCDADPCRLVRAVTRGGPYERIADSVRDDLAAIGIGVKVDVLEQDAFFDAFFAPATRAPIYIGLAFGKSFMSASTFFKEQFYGPISLGPDVTNGTLVGATREQLVSWGYEPRDVPNIDDRIEACLPLVGSAQFECWARLDQYLMEEVVPLVPYAFDKYPTVVANDVVSFSFDQLWAEPSWDRIALRG